MPALEVFDTVVLKANRLLIGIVDRTHFQNHDPLLDILIIAHISVDPNALTEFVNTGTPPRNHVFVRFSDEAQGSSLVHEDDVVLLDRNFNLGDVVKRKDEHILGTVTSVKEIYTLQPVWLIGAHAYDGLPGAAPFDDLDVSQHICLPTCPSNLLLDIEHPSQQHLLHNIPGEELKKAEDVLEADYVIHQDWIGIVEELELMVMVLLEDGSIVVVRDPDELYIPVPDLGKPLVSLPEFDNLARPDPLVALPGWSATIPPHDFQSGQMVITNQSNLRSGRWLRGQYGSHVKPQGRVIDVRTKSMDVRWLVCNAFTPDQPLSIDRPPSRLSLYENINTFPKRSELRSDKQVSVYDHNKFPRTTENRTRNQDITHLPTPTTKSPTDFRVGDHVKFRDQAGAALKYQGITSSDGMLHGRFDRIAPVDSWGFDVNELKVIRSTQESVVLWQDGTMTTQSSKDLIKFALFEPELGPADLVVAREGMKQACASEVRDTSVESWGDFNEMKFFESPQTLRPKRVGIVQSVNQPERIAQIRWFVKPEIFLRGYGHILGEESRFGPISDDVEDVSLYEIMTFPALERHLKDLIIISSGIRCTSTLNRFQTILQSKEPHDGGQTSLTQINPPDSYDLLDWLQQTAANLTQSQPNLRVIDYATYRAHPPTDWIGEIVGLGFDGTVTVRLNSRDICKDVRIEHDQIICFIDDTAISGFDLIPDVTMDDTDMDLSLGDSETTSILSETVEYEGGQRLDDDSGDDNWEDAEDEDMIIDNASPGVSTLESPSPLTVSNESEQKNPQPSTKVANVNTGANATRPVTDDTIASLSLLRSNVPTSEPPSFLVLERQPPADQYQERKDEPTPSSMTFLKRIMKEHRILASALPEGEIYVRTYESRLDLMRCLIIGPADTPYEHAPFLIDLQFGKNFPKEPPLAHFHSWTSGLGRINPNLYEEGKICLSLLGTWPGKAVHEGWNEKATILQLLVSLQGLVFVRQPFFNEAGFDEYADDKAYHVEAQRYNEKAYVMARGFVKHAIIPPVQGLEDVLAWRYLPHNDSFGMLQTVISRSNSLIESSEKQRLHERLVDGSGSETDTTKVFLRPLSRGAIVMLRKTIRFLENLLRSSSDVEMAGAEEALAEKGEPS